MTTFEMTVSVVDMASHRGYRRAFFDDVDPALMRIR